MIILIIGIVIIALIVSKFMSNDISEGFVQIDVDDLEFSKKELHPDKKNRPIYSFPLPLPLENLKPPSKNSDKVVVKELDYLVKLTNQKGVEGRKKLCEKIEKEGVFMQFLKYAGSNGLIYDEKHLKEVAKDTETVSFLFKSYYNRPRPYQLGFLLGRRIDPVVLPESSSYPCEHTLISRVLADQLIHNNPKHKQKINQIAKKIELSRYYGGTNFPSDTVGALKIAKIIKDRIKFLNIKN